MVAVPRVLEAIYDGIINEIKSKSKLEQTIFNVTLNIAKYYIDLGIDGFRMDVISLIAKDERFLDTGKEGYDMAPEYFAFQPKLHEYLRQMREICFDGRNCMCVGETTFVNTNNANSVVGDGRELDLLFQFDLMDIDGKESKWDLKQFELKEFKNVIDKWQKAIEWNTLFWSNHDQPRVVSRFGSTTDEYSWKTSSKMLACAMYLLKGTPFIYQGEEIGMTNYPFTDENELRDVESINLIKETKKNGKDLGLIWEAILAKGRDNARTPIQWNDDINGGFTKGKPWIEVNPNYRVINVNKQINEENSIVNFYKELIAFRNNNDIILKGEYKQIMFDSNEIFAYERMLDDKKIVVYCNFTNKEIMLPVSINVEKLIDVEVSNDGSNYVLNPYGALVIKG